MSNKTKRDTNYGIVYKGKVSIEYTFKNKIKKRIGHNNGTPEFFRFIANSIAGENESANMPKYIHIYKSEGGNSNDLNNLTKISACASNIPYSYHKVQKGNDGISYEVIFQFIIPYSQITVSQGTSIDVLALFPTVDTQVSNILAYYQLDSNKIEPDVGTNVIVTWSLNVSNQTE